ncbi:MAG: PH domain-containing protein [Oscillospiraceae bacterium]|nr:PH domain-containing protein [Oscillospiraceae bacterium]MBQ4538186.1 PH domain-containing protein [Oscillospiraceae bacterium]
MDKAEYIWQDRKRTIFGLPWSFTVYRLVKDKLLIETGFLSKKQEEVRLYRIMDLTLHRPIGQRLWGLGTIHCCTADKSTPDFDILKIKDSERVKNLISDMVEQQREEKRISAREFMVDHEHDECVEEIHEN